MKFLILALSLMASQAYGFDMMKCNSIENGTVWASFGRFWESGKTEPQIFPTEIVIFGKDAAFREVYNMQDALNVEVLAQGRVLRLKVNLTNGTIKQTHLLQLVKFDEASVPNGYMGNWTISEEGKADRMGLAACSVH